MQINNGSSASLPLASTQVDCDTQCDFHSYFFTPHRDGKNALFLHTHRFVMCLQIENVNLHKATGHFHLHNRNSKKKQPSRLSHQDMYNLRYKSLIFARSHDTLARWCLENHQNIWGDLLLCWKVAAMSSEHFWSWKSRMWFSKGWEVYYVSSWIIDSLSVSFCFIRSLWIFQHVTM